MYKQYVIIYDTEESVNNRFEISAMNTQSALDAFYYEVETETKVIKKTVIEL